MKRKIREVVLAIGVAALVFGSACSNGPGGTGDAGGAGGDAGADASGEPPCELTLPGPNEEPFERLRDYCFFRGEPTEQHVEPSEGVVPYDVRSKLYSDKSDKFRFFVLPEGEKIGFDEKAVWSFPEGSVIIKTFYYPDDARKPDEGRRLLETRLMIKREGEWKPLVYLWDKEQTRAKKYLIGENLTVKWTDEEGKEVTTDYRVPNKNKCKSCHSKKNKIAMLGPRTRQLNRTYEFAEGKENQLEHFEQLGLFDKEVPPVDKLDKLPDPKNENLSLDKRARAYLEGNCAHCHHPVGGASNSGVFFGYEQEDKRKLGVCKRPVAAGDGTGGYDYDIKPGHPDQSIVIYRMKSNDPEIKMPELPLRTVDHFGVDLMTKWIAQMKPKGCKKNGN